VESFESPRVSRKEVHDKYRARSRADLHRPRYEVLGQDHVLDPLPWAVLLEEIRRERCWHGLYMVVLPGTFGNWKGLDAPTIRIA
jgi:hypothetical protein